jgi:poly-gamma-glutamate capsule biosynthesis protein CapA/YwtB (metallophosphatase superfamily)
MRLLLVGDVMLGRLVNRALRQRPPAFVWGDTLDLFASADCRICNLECAICGHPAEPPEPKMFCFCSDAANVAVLRAAGIDAVSLANNHALDAGRPALLEMVRLLDQAGVAHAGAGADAAAARRPAIIERAGMRVGLLACTDNEPSWEAHHGQPGVFHVPDDAHDARAEVLVGCVEVVRATSDLVIVSLHWGPNWGTEPPPAHRRMARRLIDAGADVIFGHSAHITRGIEFHRSRAILYGAGNFIDDYAVDPVERNDESGIFVVETDGPVVRRVLVHPTFIGDFQAQLARGSLAERIALRMRGLCALLGTEAEWRGDALEVIPALEPSLPSSP